MHVIKIRLKTISAANLMLASLISKHFSFAQLLHNSFRLHHWALMFSIRSFVSKHFRHKGSERRKEPPHPSPSSTMTNTILAFTDIDSINILWAEFLAHMARRFRPVHLSSVSLNHFLIIHNAFTSGAMNQAWCCP